MVPSSSTAKANAVGELLPPPPPPPPLPPPKLPEPPLPLVQVELPNVTGLQPGAPPLQAASTNRSRVINKPSSQRQTGLVSSLFSITASSFRNRFGRALREPMSAVVPIAILGVE